MIFEFLFPEKRTFNTSLRPGCVRSNFRYKSTNQKPKFVIISVISDFYEYITLEFDLNATHALITLSHFSKHRNAVGIQITCI